MLDEGTVMVASFALLMTDTYACIGNIISFENGSVRKFVPVSKTIHA
jgi:hypothetical protein